MIDTRAKRESATKLLVPSYVQTICPTGTLDRPGVLWLYNGFGAGAAVVSVVHALTWNVESTGIFAVALESTKTILAGVNSTKTLTHEVQ